MTGSIQIVISCEEGSKKCYKQKRNAVIQPIIRYKSDSLYINMNFGRTAGMACAAFSSPLTPLLKVSTGTRAVTGLKISSSGPARALFIEIKPSLGILKKPVISVELKT